MAFFKYLGEPPRQAVKSYGPTVKIRLPQESGEPLVLEAADPAKGFVPGERLPQDIQDPQALKSLRHDKRFEEIL